MSREMVASKTPWISEYPADWRQVPLHALFGEHKAKNKEGAEQNLLSLSYGNIIRKDINANEGLLPESFNGYNIIDDGDIVLRLTDLQNDHRSLRTGLVTERGIITSAYVTLRKKIPLSSEYYHYLLHAFDIMKVFYTMGEGIRQSLGYDELAYMVVPQPSFAEQHTIVRYLDSKCAAIDEAIERHKKIIEKLEEYRRSFVTNMLTKGVSNDCEYRNSGVQQLGQIPVHWTVLRLKHLLSDDKVNLRVGPFGSTLSTKEYTDEGPWVYTQRTVLDDDFENNPIHVSDEKYVSLEGFAVYEGDLLVTTRGSIGKLAITPKNAPKGILHPCLIKFRVDQNRIHHRILKYLFNDTDLVMNQIRKKAEGATIEALYSGPLKDVYLPLPPYSEQLIMLDILDIYAAKTKRAIDSRVSVIRKLEEYRKSIIYNAVTGRIDCREVTI